MDVEHEVAVLGHQADAHVAAAGSPAVDEPLIFDPRRLRPRLLRWPAPPYLLLGDLTAFTASRLVHFHPHLADAATLLVLVICFQAAGLYRSRLTLSLLDDVPRLFEVHPAMRDTDDVRDIPLIRVRRAPFRTPTWRLKRVFDVAFAAVALVVAAPVMAACALAVRWEGGPEVLFRQVRVGLDGRSFEVLKFRSLKPATEEESAVAWNIAHDERLGRVGRFLRQTSPDELPQLWNILINDMSVVGPRPERPHFVSEFNAGSRATPLATACPAA